VHNAAAAGGPPGQLVGNYLVDSDDGRVGSQKRSQSEVRAKACQTEVLDALTPLPTLGRQLEPSARQNAKDPAGALHRKSLPTKFVRLNSLEKQLTHEEADF